MHLSIILGFSFPFGAWHGLLCELCIIFIKICRVCEACGAVKSGRAFKCYSDFKCCRYCRDLKTVAKFIFKKMQMLQNLQIGLNFEYCRAIKCCGYCRHIKNVENFAKLFSQKKVITMLQILQFVENVAEFKKEVTKCWKVFKECRKSCRTFKIVQMCSCRFSECCK